jgi:ribosomal protein S18 acetylase RimI-like enzyme
MLDWMYSSSALARQLQEGHQFIIYKEENHPIGFAGFGPKTGNESTWRLEKLYVLPDQQGRGIGKILLEEVIGRILASGGEELELNVNRNNKAVQFYMHHGFSIKQTVDLEIGGGFFMNDYILSKALKKI